MMKKLILISALLFSFNSWAYSETDLEKLKTTNACVGCDLSGADLTYASLNYADLRNADLRNANLYHANLSGANLNDANLSDANLNDANLSDAYLAYTNLRSANLHKASLHNANLRNADLRGANLTDARLNYADLTDAKFDLDDAEVTEDKQNEDPYDFVSGFIHGFLFWPAILINTFSWILSKFDINLLRDITIIGKPNNGFGYGIGYLFGVATCFVAVGVYDALTSKRPEMFSKKAAQRIKNIFAFILLPFYLLGHLGAIALGLIFFILLIIFTPFLMLGFMGVFGVL